MNSSQYNQKIMEKKLTKKEIKFEKYKRVDTAEMHEYDPNNSYPKHVMDRVSISASDKENGSPKKGDMIARNPKNHDDMWLVAKKYFKDNFKPIKKQKKTTNEEKGASLSNSKEILNEIKSDDLKEARERIYGKSQTTELKRLYRLFNKINN